MPFRCCTAALIAVILVTTNATSRELDLQVNDLPVNLLVQPLLSDEVKRMLRASPTFRDQCRLIRERRRVVIRVELIGEVHPPPTSRAQCAMARYQFGHISAVVRLWSIVNAPELIAHELEHILEFEAGLNYRAVALLQPAHVWQVGDGHFETRRAIEMGERVALEMRRDAVLARKDR
jgi:hypothetical protein